ncbi:MAG: hypothetical protein ABI113_19215 [Mucilaginibacter sp.]
MIMPSIIRLTFQDTLVIDHQFLLLYEFVIDDDLLFKKDDKTILAMLMETRILHRTLEPPELEGQKVNVCVSGIWRPFNFEILKSNHFKFLQDEASFNVGIEELKRSETGSDYERITIEGVSAEQRLVQKRTGFKNGVWLLDRDWFKNDRDDALLDELHWIYIYYKTYVEIDRTNKLIRTMDFGWD